MGYYVDYHRAEVLQVTDLTPHLIRLTFGGADLARFASSGDPDERLVIVLPPAGRRHTPAPVRLADGTLDYPGADAPAMRSYTVRRWDREPAQMTIDIVRHGGGAAAGWASGARPGDVVYLSPATGWYAPPADAGWQVLLADLSGLPALARIAEELPSGQRALAVVEVPSAADRQELAGPVGLDCRWLVGGNGTGPSLLLGALRRLRLPTSPGYLWFAGEAAASRAVRRYVRRELGWSADRFTILGYWRAQQESWLRRYREAGGERLERLYAEAIERGLSPDDALEAYDEALAAAGL